MHDERIIALFFDRSDRAIPALDSKYGRLCSHTAKNILGSREDAEECVNDTYLKVWDAIPPTRPHSLAGFVLRIVQRLSLNRLEYNRAAKRMGNYQECLEELGDVLAHPDTPESLYDAKLLSGYIDEFLSGLSETNQKLFVRRYWYLDTYPALAKATGLGQGAIRTRLSRLRQQLREYLAERGVYV